MAAGILITLREGLEAFLVIGVLLGILSKANQRGHSKYVWWGSLGAILMSMGLAYVIQRLSIEFEGPNAHWFELVVAGFAIGVLSYMVTWMNRQSHSLRLELERKVNVAISGGQVRGLTFLAFITVLREGIETALFLSAVANSSQDDRLMVGAVIGLALAAAVAYLVVTATVRLNLRKFFLFTGSFIVVIAGGLVAHVAGVLQELGLVALLHGVAWDLSGFISDESLAGKLLHAFTGYVSTPTILQMLAYAAYVGGMLFSLWRTPGKGAPRVSGTQRFEGA